MKKMIGKRLLSLLLCLVMVASYLPASILGAVAAGSAALTIQKVADPSTKDGWKSYFGTGDNITTDNAGGIWTDKSVFTDASAFQNIVSDSQGNPVSITMKNENDLLVALSAMASNMTVSGQASVPTDTMLVLDVSGSMNDGNNDVAQELAQAANTTITQLLSSNPNNRVGVVLFSGTSSSSTNNDAAVILLPLGRYTTGADNEYVSYTSTGFWDTTETISLDPDVRIQGTSTRPASTAKEVVGATYIQKGVYLAMTQLTAVSNETTANGVPRKPIMVLMSDGAPTLSATNFTAPGQYTLGNGQSSSANAAQGFVTQLTCAYAKAKVEEKYATDALFYTIGLGTTGNAVATSVLNPSRSNSGINEFWRQYNLASVGGTVNVQGSGGSARRVTKISTALEQNYVDKYIGVTADTDLAQGLKDAFAAIVSDIQLQSKYFPTLVGSSQNLSGYVSFADKIGAYMSVKDVKGILLHDQLFSGLHLAQNFVEGGGILGTEAEPKAAGTAMMESVRDRLGLGSNEVAISLINNAYYYGQLAFDPATGEFSNYIGWYADAQGQYLGFYQEGVTQLPAEAVYTVKSYGFLGDTDEAHGVAESDMMYATVQVRHHVATGEEEMLLKIPAALIPTITYEVALDQNGDLENLTASGASYPFRLLYEVGLDPHINSLNVTEYVSQEYLNATGKDGKRFTVNADGSINFYTNKFDAQLETGYGTSNTYSYFNPSHQNDKYYFQDHALVYADENGTPYTGNTAPSAYNGTLYRQHISYKKVNALLITDVHYHKLAAEGRAAAVRSTGENTWYVPEGTVYTNMEGFTYYKGYASTYDPSQNLTDTLTYAKQPFVDVYGHSVTETNHNFTIGSTLGNNGKLTLMPATGIKLTKTLAEGTAATNALFTFTIENLTNTADSGTYDVVLAEADGELIGTATLTFQGGKATVQLHAGEVVYLVGLADGTQYKITESKSDDYVAINETVTVTVADQKMVTADFVNKERGTGDLMITKELKHTQEGHAIPESVQLEWFWVKVDLGAEFAGKTVLIDDGTTSGNWLVGNDGTLPLQIRHGQTLSIRDLPEGTQVTVTELTDGMPAFFSYERINSRDHSGAELDNDGTVTIGNETNSTVIVHNLYTPIPTSVDLDVQLTKDFQVESALSLAADFTFALQKWNGTIWEDMDTDTITYAAGENGKKVIDLTDIFQNETYTAVGDYAYQIIEVIPDAINKLPGVSYDRTVWTFSVHVIDNHGRLMATVADDGVPVSGTYNVTFTNTYHTAPASLEVRKELDITSGSTDIAKAGFLFAAYEATANWALLDDVADLSVRSDAIGEARFTATYNQPGTHYFVVKEVDEGKPGWIYDTTEYRVTVVITEEADGNLVAAMTVEKVTDAGTEAITGGTITFQNTYDPTEATVNLDTAVRKELTGRTLRAKEFTFGVFPDGLASNTTIKDALMLGVNDENGNVDFPGELTFDKVGTYRYDVAEFINDMGGITYDTRIFDLVVEVTDDGNGHLQATYYYEDATGQTATFTNTYKATEATYTVTGDKRLTGKSLINDEFTFLMQECDANGGVVPGSKTWTATNGMDGKFAFPTITYTQPGVYHYLVTEKQEAASGGITFDDTRYIVTVTVTDNGAGQLLVSAIVNSPDGQIHFVNHYVPAKTSGVIPGDKVLEGKVLGAGAFQFQLHSSNANWEDLGILGQSVTNDANGKFQFPEIEYTQAGTYYYLVSEVNGGQTIDGVIYDDSVFRVQVTVTDDLKGQLHAETLVFDEDNIPQIGVQFINVYEITGDTGLVLIGTKELTGKNLANGQFTFELYPADENYTITGAPVQSATNQNGQFVIRLDYTAQDDLGKTYHYVLKEKNAGQTIGGITYSDKSYHIQVRILDDGKGSVTQEITVNDMVNQVYLNNVVEVSGFRFTNTYNVTPTTVGFVGTKRLVGRDLVDGQFTFELYKTDSSFAVTGAPIATTTNQGGGFSFQDLPIDTAGSHYYVIREKNMGQTIDGVTYDNAEYHITVDFVDIGRGELYYAGRTVRKIAPGVDALSSAVSFVNTYDPTDAYVNLIGSKALDGKRLEEGMFTFELYATDSSFSTAGVTPTTAKNTDYGLFSFSNLTFDKAGTYYYVLKEQNAGQTVGGITYAGNEYRITVTVTDDGKGQLIPAVSVAGGRVEVIGNTANVTELSFRNSYEAKPNTVSFLATKALTGIRPIAPGDFTFHVYRTDSSFSISGLSPELTVQNGAAGAIFFPDLKLNTPGKHYFVIAEDRSNPIGGVTYDDTQYQITVTVTDDGNGQLQVTDTAISKGGQTVQSILFENSYTAAPATVTVSGTKTMEGRALQNGEFTFQLQETDANFTALPGSAPQDVVNSLDGSFAFRMLSFDAPGTYYYTVTEKAGDPNVGITYDDTVYEITVVVTDNGQGQLIPTVRVNNTQAQVAGGGGNATVTGVRFHNTYTTIPAAFRFLAYKQLIGDMTLKADDFSFSLYPANAEYVITGAALNTVYNDADGYIEFSRIIIDAAGTYHYVIKENSQNPIPGVTYDDTVYHLSVTVEDSGNGVLNVTGITAKKVTASSTEEVQQILFVNSYDATDVTLNLGGTKKLTGKALTAGEFTFQLQATDSSFAALPGSLPKQTVNAGDGTFTFDAITYDKVGTYYYTVTELDTGNERTTFDTTVYYVTVTVTDEGGTLKATATYATENASAAEIVFNNVYTPKPVDLPVLIDIEKTVENLGTDKIGPEGFTFLLEGNGIRQEATSDKDGKAQFRLTFSEADIGKTYTYKVSEKNDGKTNVTYSTAVYEYKITIGLGDDNKLTATVTCNGAAELTARFVNQYKYTPAETPATGDSMDLTLWFTLLVISTLAIAAGLIGKKKFVK